MWPITSTQYDAERRIWSGPKRKDIYSENITLGEVIYDQLLKHPKKIIQICDVTGETMTGEELLRNAETLVKHFLEMGVRRGDFIGLYAGNSTHVVTVMLASFLCGTPVNPLFAGFDLATVTTMFKLTLPKIIFCDVENHENAANVNKDLNLNVSVIVMNGEVEGLTNVRDLLRTKANEDSGFRFPCLDLKGNDIVAILCSSGTTGPPKGVLITHQQTLNRPGLVAIKSDSVLFSTSAMFWLSGVCVLVASLLNACLRIITERDFTGEYLLNLVQRYKVTHISMNATQVAKMSLVDNVTKGQESLATIEIIATGGTKIPLVVQEKIHKMLSNNINCLGLDIVYGMTELGGIVSYNGGYQTERLVGSEGKLLANMEVRLISKEGKFLGPNEHGEICISTSYPWPGYYQNEEENRKALMDGWFRTGDIGYFNDDGFLHICTRDVHAFISRHFRIYPQVLEDIIMAIPGLSEVCVVGIPDLIDFHLTACAVVRTADEKGRNLTSTEIEDTVRSKMDNVYHLSGGVYFVDAIPKTSTGKVLRKNVLDIILNIREEKNAA